MTTDAGCARPRPPTRESIHRAPPRPRSGRPFLDGRGVMADTQLPLWEVFTQAGHGAPHEHAGSVHAADAEQAMQNARDVYARRGEAVSLWIVPSSAIVASAPGDAGPFFDPGNEKPKPNRPITQM